MRKKVWLITVLIGLLLAACGPGGQGSGAQSASSSQSGSASSQGEIHDLGGLLFPRDKVDEVLIWVTRTGFDDVYLTTNQDERASILDVLYSADLSGFAEQEQPGYNGSAAELKLVSGDKEVEFKVINDLEAQYLVTKDDVTGEVIRKGPAGAFDFPTLKQAVGEARANIDDPDYSGTVTLAGTDSKIAISKASCAWAMGLMDRTLDDAGTAQEPESASYNIQLTVGTKVYGIDGETGACYRTENGETRYVSLDSNTLDTVKLQLSVF